LREAAVLGELIEFWQGATAPARWLAAATLGATGWMLWEFAELDLGYWLMIASAVLVAFNLLFTADT